MNSDRRSRENHKKISKRTTQFINHIKYEISYLSLCNINYPTTITRYSLTMVSLKLTFLVLSLAVLTYCENQQFDLARYKSSLISSLSDVSQRSLLKSQASLLKFPGLFRENHVRDSDDTVNELICSVCDATVDAVIAARVLLGVSTEDIRQVAIEVCVDFGIENDEVCQGVIDLNLALFLYIIDNKQNLLGSDICSIVLQGYECSKFNPSDWSVEIPAGYSKPHELVSTGETFKFIHISDFHYDPTYQPYGNRDCSEPLCCQSDHPGPESEKSACGYWSDYKQSDTPIHLVENSLAEIKEKHSDAEFAIYTGDVISHRVWSTSVANNSRDLRLIYGLLNSSLDFPVYPIFGNHEPNPLNVWAPDNITDPDLAVQWVFNVAVEMWSAWLPRTALATVNRGGYYTFLVYPGLRIIGLNSNFCYISNWWLFYDDEDPYGELKWLVNVLSEAEDAGEAVYIISHVPPNSKECLSLWSSYYREIVERFANNILGQFNGHTHTDIFSIFYNSSDPTQAINSAFNGASITTFTGKNPSYKVYYADKGSFEILDYEEYTFNLTEANLTPDEPPKWYKLYSFKEAYGVNSLRPSDLNELAENMAKNKSLLDQYFVFKSRNSDYEVPNGCNDSCKKNNLCAIVTSAQNDNVRCEQLLEMYDNY